MALSGSRLAQELVKKSLALHKRLAGIDEDQLHSFFFGHYREKFLAIATPGNEPPIRLTFHLLPENKEDLDRLFSSSPEEAYSELSKMHFGMFPPGTLSEEWIKFLKRGGFHPSAGTLVPGFFIQDGDLLTEAQGGKLLRLFLLLMDGVLKAMKKGLFSPPGEGDRKEVPMVAARGVPPNLEVTLVRPSARENFPAEEGHGEDDSPAPWEREDLPRDLKEWKKADREVTTRLASLVKEKDLHDPRLLSLFFGSAEEAEQVIHGEDFSPLNAYLEWLGLEET